MIIKSDAVLQLVHQIKSLYPGGRDEEQDYIERAYPVVMEKINQCFSHVKNKYYHMNGEVIFNPLHSAHWTMFLYLMGHEICKRGDRSIDLCDKIYGLSKMVSSADIFYEVQMPDIWFFDHPQGSVMGRARYGNFFTFSQGCTVGGNKDIYPNIGEHVSMMSCSQILGKCDVGDHVIFAANSCIIDESVPSYSIVFGSTPNIIIHSISDKKFNALTNSMFDGNDSMEKNREER